MDLSLKDIQLILREYCDIDRRKENFDFFSGIALYLFLTMLIIWTKNIWVSLIGSIALSMILIRFFELFHEYNHGVILKNSSIARVFFIFYGSVTIFPSFVWTYTHNMHHKNVGRLSHDFLGYFPMMGKKAYQKMSIFGKVKYQFIRSLILPIFAPFYIYFIPLGILLKNEKSRKNILLSFAVYFVFLILLYYTFGWINLLFIYIIPFVILIWIGTTMLFLQHNFQGVKYYTERKDNYLQRIIGSSNTITTNSFGNWVLCHSGYHLIHHLEPKIPYYRLEAAHKALTKHIEVPTTRLTLSNVIKSYQQKLFDIEKGEAISWRSLNKS